MDRDRNKVIDFQVTKSRNFSSYLPMALRLEKKYNIEYLCTDAYESYAKYSLSRNHSTTNDETSLVLALLDKYRDLK